MSIVSGVVKDEILAALVGNEICKGADRVVYTMRDNARWVIKKARTECRAANKNEWEVWQDIKVSEKLASLFGKCQAVGETYEYLVMERLNALDETDSVPDMPVWLVDRKRQNLGKAANGDIKVKVRDYGHVRECDDRINAPMQSWPSGGETSSMQSIVKSLKEIEAGGE